MRYSGFLLLLLLAPASAWACWDGISASDGPICISWAYNDGAVPFSLEGAHQAAQSIRRLRPLLRPGEKVDLVFGDESSCGDDDLLDDGVYSPAALRICPRSGKCFRLPLKDADEEAALQALARHNGRPLALSASDRIWTVQAIASRNEEAAQAMESKLEDYTPGFYVAAGHPGRAHATETSFDGIWHRVRVGAFLDRKSASQAREELRDERGIEGWVRIAP